MCLEKAKRIKCKKDIVCYKLAFVPNHLNDTDFDAENVVYKTIYQYFPITFNNEMTASWTHSPNFSESIEMESEDDHYFEVEKKNNKKKIYGGMFHSYRKLRTAISEANAEFFYCYVIKCTIPKGSILFKGKFCGEKCYASSKIIFNEIVYRNKDEKLLD